MNVNDPRVTPDWLAVREAADAASRAADLVDRVLAHLDENPNPWAAGPGQPLDAQAKIVVHDLGTGTGSMGRWLAPLLPGPQHWVMYDRDPELLKHAEAAMVREAADGEPVTVETRQRDITALTADDLRGATLVTASALLDMLTAPEIERIVAACAEADCLVLMTTSVVGRVELNPPDPLDADIEAAFNAHQRRLARGRRLLGPDAVDATIEEFGRHGMSVLVRPSPWRLGVDDTPLIVEWFTGWVAAACEQRPDLAHPVAAYATRRLAEAAAGRLEVVVHHRDVLAVRDR